MAITSNVFKFISLHAPRKVKPGHIGTHFVHYDETYLAPGAGTAFQMLRTIVNTGGVPEDVLEDLVTALETLMTDPNAIIPNVQNLYLYYPKFEEIEEWLNANKTTINVAALTTQLEAFLGVTLTTFVSDAYFKTTWILVWDTLIARIILADDFEMASELTTVIQVLQLIRRLEDADPTLSTTADIIAAAEATVVLPSPIFPLPRMTPDVPTAPEEAPSDPDEEAEAAFEKIGQLRTARAEIQCLYEKKLDELKRATDVPLPDLGQDDAVLPESSDERADYLSADTVSALSSTTEDLLTEMCIVQSEGIFATDVLNAMDTWVARLGRTAYRNVSGTSQVMFLGGNLIQAKRGSQEGEPSNWVTIPKGAGAIKPLGVGELLVLRQDLLCYEPGEIAHIENVMASESKERETRRFSQVIETTILERESTNEEEKDTQTTERFEMERHASKIIQEDSQFTAGVDVSASYGPVMLHASANYANSSSTTSATEEAVNYARSVVERARQRIVERVREQKIRIVTEEFEEKNKHGFDNSAGTDHIVGIYRWIDKYYKNQIFNYGKRLMFEFIVPEPAAFYIHAQANTPLEGVTLSRPVHPADLALPLGPIREAGDIDETNYLAIAAKYSATGITPPPQRYIHLGKAFNREPNPAYEVYTSSNNDLEVPSGYKGIDASGRVLIEWGANANTTIYLGMQRFWAKVNGSAPSWTGSTNGQVQNIVFPSAIYGALPISIQGRDSLYYIANIQITCERTEENFEQWQIATYNAILDAYNNLEAKYQNDLAEAKARTGVVISGKNPLRNRVIEKEELKRGALQLFTDQNFELFNAMADNQPSAGYPEFSNPEAIAEGDYIQFFEQAFEWDQMTYLFYPYFWGRKPKWVTMRQTDDADPIFTNFLSAGAARIIVPVRPAYDDAVLYFLSSGGVIWNGGSKPTIDDKLFVSIINILKADEEGDEVGDPWETRLPTNLVVLQADASPLDEDGLPCYRE